MLTGCAIMVRMTADYSHDWSQTRMEKPDNNPLALAGASDTGVPTPQTDSQPQEVFPVMFDKDYMDFRPEEVSAEELAPKGFSAQELASEQRFSDDLIPSLELVSESPEAPEPTSVPPTSVPPTVGTDS